MKNNRSIQSKKRGFEKFKFLKEIGLFFLVQNKSNSCIDKSFSFRDCLKLSAYIDINQFNKITNDDLETQIDTYTEEKIEFDSNDVICLTVSEIKKLLEDYHNEKCNETPIQ